MFFRFLSGIVLIVLISVGGVAIEKQVLALQREVTCQHYRMEALLDLHARLRLKTQHLGSPERLYQSLEAGELEITQPDKPAKPERTSLPLLRWQRPASPKRVRNAEFGVRSEK